MVEHLIFYATFLVLLHILCLNHCERPPSILFFQFGMILPNGGGQWWIFTNSIEGTILKYTVSYETERLSPFECK